MSANPCLRGLNLIAPSTDAPHEAVEGSIYFNTTTNTCYVRDHGKWVPYSVEKEVKTSKVKKSCPYCGGYDREVARHRCVGCGAPVPPEDGAEMPRETGMALCIENDQPAWIPTPPPPPGPRIVKCA
jgi:hypothetical protein